ncbi:MAG: Coenzyme F420 hydrogenase/dehydrogenase, beta subunit C-terminal domain [Ruminococcus sp.]
MMILYTQEKDCCGCTACMTVCPKKAIEMKTDAKGFAYPELDLSLCVECGLCEKACAFQNGYCTEENLPEPQIYAVQHLDEQERATSRSGGMFAALCKWFFDEMNGVVYGVGYEEHFRAVHKRAENQKEAFEFKGSKYVQSDMGDIFSQVREDLKAGRNVLFSGTPCQTAGLRSALCSVNTDNLYVCDIVCHGTPSPVVWEDYLTMQEKKNHSKAVQVDFRDKSQLGWTLHFESVTFENGTKIIDEIYTDLFYKHIMLRPSCGNCKYTNFQRPSDITLADFWGIGKAVPEMNDNKGVSLILVNTPKGEHMFQAVEDKIRYKESTKEKCMQPNLKQPSVFSGQTDAFWKDYFAHGFEYAAKKYGILNFKGRLKFRLKMRLKHKVPVKQKGAGV